MNSCYDSERIKHITKQREKRTIEYKEAYSELPGNLFETVCAFLNRDGGVIVLGVHDDGTITDGVSRNIYKYVPLYTDKQPVIDDENVYTVKMALPTLMNAENSVRQEGVTETTQKTTEKIMEKIREKIVETIKNNSTITSKELATLTEFTAKGIEWHLKKLQSQGIIRRVGPDKGGHWEIIE